MQTADILFNNHDKQIQEIKENVSEIKVTTSVMSNNYKHLSEKINEVLDIVNRLKDSGYTIKEIEKNLTELQLKVAALEKNSLDENKKIEDLERKTNRLKGTLLFVKDHWGLIIALLAALAWIMDFLYKIDPKHFG